MIILIMETILQKIEDSCGEYIVPLILISDTVRGYLAGRHIKNHLDEIDPENPSDEFNGWYDKKMDFMVDFFDVGLELCLKGTERENEIYELIRKMDRKLKY